jgi:hypothetical protein
LGFDFEGSTLKESLKEVRFGKSREYASKYWPTVKSQTMQEKRKIKKYVFRIITARLLKLTIITNHNKQSQHKRLVFELK